MGILQVEYPDNMTASLDMDRETFEQEARMAMAVKLFEMGCLTSGQAALLAGRNRAEFLLECPRYGVASVSWDKDELAAEFQNLPFCNSPPADHLSCDQPHCPGRLPAWRAGKKKPSFSHYQAALKRLLLRGLGILSYGQPLPPFDHHAAGGRGLE